MKSKLESTNMEPFGTTELTTQAKSIEQIRTEGMSKQTLDRIAAERAEMERQQQEAKERLPGKFLSLKSDGEERTFLFSGEYQKVQVPLKDWETKQIIPGKTTTRWRFQVYDITNPDNPSEVSIFERGATEAQMVFHWLQKGKAELTIIRNGAPNSQKTSYNIFPAVR
jgi:hypothetical protein